MSFITKYRSESIAIHVTVKVNGVAVDLSLYSNIAFVVYYKNNQVLAKYSRETLTGYDTANFQVIQAGSGVSITDKGRFDILIQPSVSLPANLDEVRGEINVQKVDARWEDGFWKKIKSGIVLFQISDAFTKAL